MKEMNRGSNHSLANSTVGIFFCLVDVLKSILFVHGGGGVMEEIWRYNGGDCSWIGQSISMCYGVSGTVRHSKHSSASNAPGRRVLDGVHFAGEQFGLDLLPGFGGLLWG